jgi:hypothetical protein
MATRKSRSRPPLPRRTVWLAAFVGAVAILFASPSIISLSERIIGGERAVLEIDSSADTVTPGQSFTVQVALNTKGTNVNAAGIAVKFDPRSLEIVQMSTVDSFCSFYAENSFDTIKGEVHLSCGTPNPGFTGTSNLVTLTMRSKIVGKSEISIEPDAQILANDGKGTNLLKSGIASKTITVKQTF